MEELYNALQKLVGYEVETVLVSDDDVQVKFSNGNGVSINLLIDEEGINISDPYAPCHLCCERHECSHDDEDGAEWEDDEEDEVYMIGYGDGYSEGYNDALKSKRRDK